MSQIPKAMKNKGENPEKALVEQEKKEKSV